jgi:hypothetical protein
MVMKTGKSELVREVADREYISPARSERKPVKIVVGDIHRKLREVGFPAGHTNQICTSLESEKFWKERGLELCSPLGQPRRHSTVFEFRFRGAAGKPNLKGQGNDPLLELMGVLKGAIREGADAFVKELRRDKVYSK